MRIKHSGLIGLAWMAALIAVPALALAQTTPIGKNGDVELKAAVHVGSTTLKPGHYRFQHRIADGQHYLVVREQQTSSLRGGQHYAGATGAEVARIECTVVSIDRKLTATEVHMRKDANGMVMLTQIRIAGEKDGHIVALEPRMMHRDAPR